MPIWALSGRDHGSDELWVQKLPDQQLDPWTYKIGKSASQTSISRALAAIEDHSVNLVSGLGFRLFSTSVANKLTQGLGVASCVQGSRVFGLKVPIASRRKLPKLSFFD